MTGADVSSESLTLPENTNMAETGLNFENTVSQNSGPLPHSKRPSLLEKIARQVSYLKM